jgi:hypothetical protein
MAVGAWAGRAYAPEPTWAHALSDRLAEQEELLHQEQRALDGLTGMVTELRSAGGLPRPDATCVTEAALRAALEGHGRGAGPQAPDAAAETAAASRDARDQAVRLVDSAAVGHSWSEENAAEFRSLLATMSPLQRDEAMSALVKALNTHQLKLEAHHPF